MKLRQSAVFLNLWQTTVPAEGEPIVFKPNGLAHHSEGLPSLGEATLVEHG